MITTKDALKALSALTPVGHALFSRDGVRLAFGKRWDGIQIHISQADRGAACGCVCPAEDCGRKLIARKPEASNVTHHFAHAPLTQAERDAGKVPNCRSGPMTALHIYAEELLERQKELVLPTVDARYDTRHRIARPAGPYRFDAAQLERMDGETVPDVILFKGPERMHVEVYVTHRCDEAKRAKIAAAEISAVEIDLSGLSRDATFADFDEAILRTAPRSWIYNRRAEALRRELQKDAEEERRQAAEAHRKRVKELSAGYSRARRKALQSAWETSPEVAKVKEVEDLALLDVGSHGEGYFSVHPKVWKAAILNLVPRSFNGCSATAILAALDRQGWLIGPLRDAARDEADILLEAKLPPGGPTHAVEAFLDQLAERGIIECSGGAWTYTRHHLDRLLERKQKREQRARDDAARRSRKNRLATLAKEIGSFAAKDAGDMDIEVWRTSALPGGTHSPDQIAHEDNAAWRALLKGLTLTLAVLKDEVEEPADDFGLPVREALLAMRTIHEERAAARAKEARDKAEAEANARVVDIEGAVVVSLIDTERAWLDRPVEALSGMTPRAAAAISAALLEKATRLLARHAAALALKAEWVAKLEREAQRLLGRADKVTLYMNTSDDKLPGKVAPRIYTIDEATMAECLALLKHRTRKR